jgi:obg-like ATPase 1
VPDARFDHLCNVYKPASKVPAFLNVTDIAGLVQGANEGKGLGNAFLSHIKACDAIFHMIRIFDDEDIVHVEGAVDPIRDIQIINDELRLKDLEYVEKIHDDVEKRFTRSGDKTLKHDYEVLHKIVEMLRDEKKWVRYHDWNDKEIEVLNKHLLLTSKPVVYLLNMSEPEYIKKKNKWLPKIKQWVDANDPGAAVIPYSAMFELKLQEMATDEERKAFTTECGATSQMEKIITTGYKALQLCYFFTAGEDEVKCWTIQVGTTAPKGAGRIHTDFEKGFIMAEVMKFEDFKEYGSEGAVKAAGKYRQQGKAYVIEDGDIILFKFNAGAGLGGGKK